jgi:predicted nucleic acid-binding protein
VVAAATASAAAQPAPPRTQDPDWPCQQRLVPHLTAASYWNGTIDIQGDWQADPVIADLVRHLSPRRVTTEEGLAEIANFAEAASKDRPHRLALVFRGLLEETDRERAELIERLTQMGRRQRELADLVARLADELNSVPPDATGESAEKRVDLQQRHDFTARNFEEIQRTIRYACEAPVALDARLGAWARALQQAAIAAAPG